MSVQSTRLTLRAFAAAAVGNLLSGLRHGDGSWAFGGPGFGEMLLVQLLTLLTGLAFGLLLRVSAAAIAAYYVLPTLWSALFSTSSGLKGIAPWFDLNQAQGPLYSHDITGTGWLQLLSAVAIWIGIVDGLAGCRHRRTSRGTRWRGRKRRITRPVITQG
jgi:hypothetical protein